MAVITFLSSKGGVGKTTAALLLATELAQDGSPIVVIDADPNFPLAEWASLPGKPGNIEVIREADEEGIVDTIDSAQRRAHHVIVDLEGRANTRVVNALLMTSLAIVPMQGSVLDANQAARTFRTIKTAGKAARREIAFTAVYTRTPASYRIRSRVASSIAKDIERAGIPALRTTIAERTAFKTLFAQGGTLASMDHTQASSLDTARANAKAFATEVLAALKPATKGVAAV